MNIKTGNEGVNSYKNPKPTNTLESIKVCIRIRPFLKHENSDDSVIEYEPYDTRKIKLRKSENCFEGYFDEIFPSNTKQEEIFNFVKDSICDVLNGINSTIFTYGQTGSGKTYTMFGSDWTLNEQFELYPQIRANLAYDSHNFIKNDFVINPFSPDNGMVPKMIYNLFSEIESRKNKCTVHCSFLQIYNEKIYDLLEDYLPSSNAPNQQKDFSCFMNNYNTNKLDGKSLNIREDKINGIYVEGLSEYIVENVYDCLGLLKKGEKNRKKRHTKKNEMSSRSHTVFMLFVEGNVINKEGTLKKAKLHLCDLAGSEKVDKDDHHKSMHFNEMVNINLSLGTLGKVIHSLSCKQSHIPYRDSKLTRLLQDSLGGNTRTYLIANISPNKENYEETVSTLKFADRAKSVLTKIKPNEITARDENLITKLTKEINDLKSILSIRKKRGNFGEIEDQFLKLKEENEQLKKYVIGNLTNDNIEKLISENKILKLELQKLRSKNEFYPNKDTITISHKEDITNYKNYKELSTQNSKNLDLIENLSSSKNLSHSYKSALDSNYEINQKIISLNLKNNLNDIFSPIDNKKISYNFHQLNSTNNKLISAGLNILSPTGARKNMSSSMLNIKNTSEKKNNISINRNLFENKNNQVQIYSNLNLKTIDASPSKFNNLNKSTNILSEIKELKAANERLKFLEQIEQKNAVKITKEMERIKNKKFVKLEEENNKKVDRQKNMERIEEPMKKISYLYRDKNKH